MKKPRFTERKRRHRVDSWRGGSHTALVLAAVLLAGCAIQNTPQQERTWAAYEACKAAGAFLMGISGARRSMVVGSLR